MSALLAVALLFLAGPCPSAAPAGFVLHLAQEDAMVTGRVVDEDGNPVAGATLIAETSAEDKILRSEATTDENGTYHLPNLYRRVPYALTIEKAGFFTLEGSEVFNNAVNTRDFTLRYAGRQLAQEAYQRGVAAFQQGDFDLAATEIAAAVEAIEGTVASDEMLHAALNALGQVELRRGNMDAAGDAYERAIALAAGNTAAHTGLGHVRDAQERYDEGAAEFRRAIELAPGDAQLHYNLGSLLIRAEKLEEAIAPLEASVRLQPEFPRAHRSLGNAYARSGARTQAIEQLELYLQQMPDAPDAEQVRALIAQLRGAAE
jgi:tetratricopeptide (TPR) repeat protein